MDGLLRVLALSIILYVVVTALLVGVVILCGGDIFKIPALIFPVIGVCTGIAAGIINENLD
jgi:hypothetical protein